MFKNFTNCNNRYYCTSIDSCCISRTTGTGITKDIFPPIIKIKTQQFTLSSAGHKRPQRNAVQKYWRCRRRQGGSPKYKEFTDRPEEQANRPKQSQSQSCCRRKENSVAAVIPAKIGVREVLRDRLPGGGFAAGGSESIAPHGLLGYLPGFTEYSHTPNILFTYPTWVAIDLFTFS